MRFAVRSFTFGVAKGVPETSPPKPLWPNFCHKKNPPAPTTMRRSTMNNQWREREGFACGPLGTVGAAVTGVASVDRGIAANSTGFEVGVEAAALLGPAKSVPKCRFRQRT